MNTVLRRLGVLILAALAACGGGGGDDAAGVQVPQGVRSGTASATSNINEGNVRSFAGPLARAVMSAGNAEQVPGVSSARDAPQARSTRLTMQGQRWLRLALANLSSREQPLATTTRPLRCPFGGGLTLTLIDDDNNAKLSAGDRLAIVTVGCRSELGQPASTGSLALAINAIELDGDDDPTALDVTITFTGFEEEGFGTLSGSVRLWFKDDDASGGQRLRLSYSATAVSENGDSLAYDFDITGDAADSGGSFDMNGTFVIGGAGYAMSSTTLRFSAGSQPAEGSVTLRDFLGNKVTLRARGDTFDLEFRPLGAPLPLIIPGFLWDAFRLPG